MRLTLYLPDKLGHQAKAAGINLSGLLREAVAAELDKDPAMAEKPVDLAPGSYRLPGGGLLRVD